MKKQLLLLMMILLPMVSNAEPVEIDGIYYNLISKIKEAEVTSNPNKYFGDIIIPTSINYGGAEYQVTAIDIGAFLRCKDLHSVTIPNSITKIGYNAFYQCTGLTSVTLPNNLTTLEERTFSGCSSLSSITIPASITTIKNGAFEVCTGLTAVSISNIKTWCNIEFESTDANPLYHAHRLYLDGEEINNLVIPNSVTCINNYAFNSCTSLISVTIPNNVTSIGNNAFQSCTSLTTIEIPNSIVSIGNMAFEVCSNLKSVIIPEKITSIGFSTFSGCTSLTSITIPNSIDTINDYAFFNCTGLTSIIIPNSVTSIGSSAFGFCSGLTSVTIGSNVKEIKNTAFSKCPEIKDVYSLAKNVPNTKDDVFANSYIEYATLHVPSVSISSYESAEPWKYFKDIIKINMPKHTLTYLVDGDLYKTFEIEEGESIVPEPAPTKEGYTFSGWSEIPKTMPAHDVTVTGTFSINKYKLTYTVDGTEYMTYEIEYGAAIIPEAKPTKDGYTFSGWSEIPETMPAHDVTVTGTFSVNRYKLTYMIDDKVYKETMYEYGATITPEAAPTKEGYTFSGWSEIPETMPARDVAVTGTFSINKYKLTYTVDGEEYKSYEVEYGATITPEAAPTKEGYTFSGWSEIPETMPAHDVKITGSFTKGEYKLTYYVDGVDYKTVSYDYGATITPETEPTKEGYTFSGWSEIPETMPAHDVTVTGTFTINKYKLTYTVNGEEYKSYEIEYGATITPESAPTKEGYTFSGWSEIPETMPAHDVTVTGTFTINTYKIVYFVDGVEYGTSEVTYGAEVNPIGEPTKEGYTFSGWMHLPEAMPAHDVTVTGTFSVNSYKVTFVYGDSVLTTIEVNYGEAIELPTSLNSERYTLVEWKDVPDTMPAHDITIYADYVDGINTITADRRDEQYIRLNGMYTPDLKPGLNIIRMKDGTTKKVWVK